MRYSFDLEGRRYYVQLEEHADGPKFIIDGTSFEPKLESTDDGYSVSVSGSKYKFRVENGAVHEGPNQLDLRIQRAKPELVRAGGSKRKGDGRIKPPMPGKVVEVQVKVGDEVSEGDPLLVLEAMKMQNDLKSPVAGTVTAVHVTDGQNVEATTVMIDIQPAEEAEPNGEA